MKDYAELEKRLEAVDDLIDGKTPIQAVAVLVRLSAEARTAISDLTKRLAIAEARPAAEGSIRVRTHGSVLEGIAARNLADDERALLSRDDETKESGR